MARRRGETGAPSLFYPAVALAMGGAFLTGFLLRHSAPRLAVHPAARLAQVAAPLPRDSALGGTVRPASPDAASVLRAAANALSAPPESAARARRTFDTVYNLVRQYYVDRLPGDRRLGYGAVRSMLSSLNDPNCFFLEPEQYALMDAEARGRYPGVGVSYSIRPQKRDGYTEFKIVVTSPVPGSPAAKAGLKAGDVITHIDGRWVLGFDPFLQANRLADRLEKPGATDSDAAAYRRELESARKTESEGIGLFAAQMALRGDEKTLSRLKLPTEKRTLTVTRAGLSEPLILTMESNTTEVPPVESRILTGGAGYLRIAAFTQKTPAQVRAILDTLPKTAPLVLDLRGNPGGALDSALDVEALLSPEGVRGDFAVQVVSAGKTVPIHARIAAGVRRPLVVLTDGGTASVAEALAATLVDRDGATLVGTKTFGDALLLAAYTLPDGAAFVLPTGRLVSPERRTEWANIGLVPGVSVAANANEEQWLARAVATLKSRPQIAAGVPGKP